MLDLDNFFDGSKKWKFTLEPGRGETYADNNPTLYAHSTYERTSVLAGRPQRVFVDSWRTVEEASTDLYDAKRRYKRFRFENLMDTGISTYIPTSTLVSHLPDDTDY